MSWALQHVKVTLEDAKTGEVVVIEQRSDGTIDCKEGGRRGKGEGAVKEAEGKAAAAKERAAEKPKEEARPKEESKAKPREAKPKTEPKAEGKTARPKGEAKPKEEAKPRARGPSKEASKSAKKPLAWRAVQDNNYDGFAAKVRHGLFKALHARNTQWALFFEREDDYPAHLGCFHKLEQAKARAQELHDAGWPESEFGEVTKEHLERACPLPGAERPEKPERAPALPTEEKPAAPTSTPAAETPAEESKDAVLLRSFAQAANSALIDDEDDD